MSLKISAPPLLHCAVYDQRVTEASRLTRPRSRPTRRYIHAIIRTKANSTVLQRHDAALRRSCRQTWTRTPRIFQHNVCARRLMEPAPVVTAELAARLLPDECTGLLVDTGCRNPATSQKKKIIESRWVSVCPTRSMWSKASAALHPASRPTPTAHPTIAGEKRSPEHWTHDASAILTKWFAHWKNPPPVREITGRKPWWRERLGEDPGQSHIFQARERIVREGPLAYWTSSTNNVKGLTGFRGWKPRAAPSICGLPAKLMVAIVGEKFPRKFMTLTERVLYPSRAKSHSRLS